MWEIIESINHIMFLCPFARQVWALSNIPSPSDGFGDSEYHNLHHLLSFQTDSYNYEESQSTFSWILWHLWKN